MFSSSDLRRRRLQAGLTQTELAERAGVSRQLVSAVENGRHLPRVDAAVALADALDSDVAELFRPEVRPVDPVTGIPLRDGSAIRIGRVGALSVASPVGVGRDGWEVADGVVEGGTVTHLVRHRPGIVVAGCEPGLEVLERMLREGGMGAVASTASSAAAEAALQAGRVHAAVVHGPDDVATPIPERAAVRYGIARWRVGLAAPPHAKSGWWREALSGMVPVIQREEGAGVQRAFEWAAGVRSGSVPGPRVGSHVDAARRAVHTGRAAVTIEPAALAVGALFHPLETHRAELFVARTWIDDRGVAEALHVLNSARFRRTLEGVGGYDLAACGTRAT